MIKQLIITISLSTTCICHAQIKHNFTMGSSNSTCDSLKIEDPSHLNRLLRETTFRYSEELKISRYKIPRKVWYFSCDGKFGYMIASETEEKEVVFENVKMDDWKALTDSKDPINQYQILKSKYKGS